MTSDGHDSLEVVFAPRHVNRLRRSYFIYSLFTIALLFAAFAPSVWVADFLATRNGLLGLLKDVPILALKIGCGFFGFLFIGFLIGLWPWIGPKPPVLLVLTNEGVWHELTKKLYLWELIDGVENSKEKMSFVYSVKGVRIPEVKWAQILTNPEKVLSFIRAHAPQLLETGE